MGADDADGADAPCRQILWSASSSSITTVALISGTLSGGWLGQTLADIEVIVVDSKYPPAEPGALVLEPLKAAYPCRSGQEIQSDVRVGSRPAEKSNVGPLLVREQP